MKRAYIAGWVKQCAVSEKSEAGEVSGRKLDVTEGYILAVHIFRSPDWRLCEISLLTVAAALQAADFLSLLDESSKIQAEAWSGDEVD